MAGRITIARRIARPLARWLMIARRVTWLLARWFVFRRFGRLRRLVVVPGLLVLMPARVLAVIARVIRDAVAEVTGRIAWIRR